MRKIAATLAAMTLTALLSAGCVERRMTLVTEPEGAIAYYNGKPVGRTPVTFHFTYYQPGDIRFEKDGYQTLRVVQPVKAPVYQRFPLDFFAEVLLPSPLCDRHTFDYTLEERKAVDVEALVERANKMREEASGPSE